MIRKKGFNVCQIFATSMLHFISWGICPMAFEWAIHSHESIIIMPPCIVYNQCVLRGHWLALSQPHFFKENESCGMSNSVSTRWCAIFIFILVPITIHAAKTNKSFCSTENFPQRQVGSRVTMCIVCHAMSFSTRFQFLRQQGVESSMCGIRY